MLKNSELKVNQGCHLKWKPGDKQSERFSQIEFLRSQTVGKPLQIDIVGFIMELIRIQVNQDCHLKGKPGDNRSEQFSQIEFLRNRTVGKPL